MNCSRCNSPEPNPGCYVCGETLHQLETMTAETITERAMEDFSTTLWAIANAAVDLSTDISVGDITPAEAAETFNKIVNDLEKLLETTETP